MEKDIDVLPPIGKPIPVDQTEHHEDGPQFMYDDVDMAVGHWQPSCLNSYTTFMDEHEFEFSFWLVKNVISNKAIDDIMLFNTIKSNLPNGHFRSVHALSK